ncbi:MAG: trehalose-phosphatase [Gammaproteobacteria bacterium]|nr:trehalose-phosphatase [Gammaproteobacteria bacterium]
MTRTTAPSPSAGWSLFLDVDGTLLEFTDSPEETRTDEALRRLLAEVRDALDGRLALISGRSISRLDELFAPLRLAAAGLHGAERRHADGRIELAPIDRAALDPARRSLASLVSTRPGLRFEDKGLGLALHFRDRPELATGARESIEEACARLSGDFAVQPGDWVFEIKPRACTKGTAVAAFLAEPPFSRGTPVFVGDDLTDLDGFRCVERHGGHSVAVGTRVRAQWWLEGPAAVRAWLAGIVDAARSGSVGAPARISR